MQASKAEAPTGGKITRLHHSANKDMIEFFPLNGFVEQSPGPGCPFNPPFD